MSRTQSISVQVLPDDDKCAYWAKLVTNETVLPLPNSVTKAGHIPAPFLLRGDEELCSGDFLVEGEQLDHSRPWLGYTYSITFMTSDGKACRIRPQSEHKQAFKAAGMAVEYLKGSGELAACVRLIHGIRMGLDPLAEPPEEGHEGPVAAQ